jgi:hypothetical protein
MDSNSNPGTPPRASSPTGSMQFMLTPEMLQQIATAAAMAAVQVAQPAGIPREKTKLTALPEFTGKENGSIQVSTSSL